MSALHLWVEASKSDAGIQSRELPVHPFLGRMAPLFPLLRFLGKRLQVWGPAIETLYRQDTACDLRDIELTAMLRGMVEFQPRGQPVRLFGREGLLISGIGPSVRFYGRCCRVVQ